MAGGLLGDLFGAGTADTGGFDLNQLVRPPDPLGAALAEMSQRFATAGQASRLPVSTLGAIGSALGGAGTAAQVQQTQYLDQAIKLQTLRRSLKQAGLDDRLIESLLPVLVRGGGPAAPGAAPAVPGAPAQPAAMRGVPVTPAAAPGAPSIAAPPLPGDFGASGDIPAMGNYASPAAPGGLPPGGGKIINTGLLGDPTQGGAGAATTLASFRPDEASPLVAAANGAANRLDPAMLRGLLAGGDDTGMAGGEGLLGGAGAPGPPDELIRGPTADLPTQLASMRAPQGDNWEVRNYNYAGMRKPGVIAGPNAGGFQAFGSPEEGINAISRQLDRYAEGKTTGKPLTTLRQMVSTWAPPNENPTSQLIDRAAKVTGFDPDQSLNVSDPAVKAKLVDAFIRNEQGGRNPVSMDTIVSAVGGATGEGGSVRPGMMLAQYAGGPPAGSGAAAVANALGGAPALVGPGSGMIPGLDMTPQQVAAFNALYGLAGHTGSPLKEFLDIYYKSPEYLRQSEQEKAAGQRAVTEPSDIRIAQQKAVEDRVTQQLKTIGDARFSLAPNGILVPDGQGGQTRVQATVEQAVRAANGLAVPELGIKGMYPDAKGGGAGGAPSDTTRPAGPVAGEPTGTLPPGYQWRTSPDGKITAQPIPNTPEAAKAEELARTRAIADRQLQVARDSVVAAADRIENNVKTSTLPTTGILGSKLTGVYQPAQDVQADIQNIEARMTLDQLNALRAGSPTGGALGAVSEGEGAKLATAMANLKQSQSKEQFLTNLQVVKQAYIDAVHGPGAWREMSDQAVLKTQPSSREWKEGQILNYPDGSQHQLTNGQWIAIKPPTQR